MALPSFFKRKPPPPTPAADLAGDESAAVQLARTRARRRLIGAVVLLAVGVTVFPLVFETRPRPLPTDIPIELPRRDAAAPRAAAPPPRAPAVAEVPVAEPAPPAASEPERVAAASAPADTPAAVPERPASRPADATPSKPPEKAAEKSPDKPVEKAAEKASTTPADKPAKPSEPTPARTAPAPDGERARALLEGRAGAAASEPRSGRFVVQVGAYTDANTLRDVRAKVEKLGLKTYTQSIDTDAGRRTRVRVGPFATRPEADAASSRLKAAGLPGNVLTL